MNLGLKFQKLFEIGNFCVIIKLLNGYTIGKSGMIIKGEIIS